MSTTNNSELFRIACEALGGDDTYRPIAMQIVLAQLAGDTETIAALLAVISRDAPRLAEFLTRKLRL